MHVCTATYTHGTADAAAAMASCNDAVNAFFKPSAAEMLHHIVPRETGDGRHTLRKRRYFPNDFRIRKHSQRC